MKWTGRYRVIANDADVNDIVSASSILRYMQDAAYSSMEEDGPSYNELYERGAAFVLSRIRMSMYSPIHIHDEIDVQSWACESRGVQFNRCYRILRDGDIVAEAVSVWALCGVKDRRLLRLSDFDLNYRTDEMIELDLPARFRIPDGVDMKLKGEKTVQYPDIDLNGHMNNTRYPDIICGFASDMRGKRAVSMCISYISEAPFGETIKVYSGYADDTHYIRTVRENGQTNIEAEVIFDSAS